MKTTTIKNSIVVLIVVILVAIGIFLSGLRFNTTKSLGDVNAYPIFAPANNTAAMCSTTSSIILGTSTSRNMLFLGNDSANAMYLSLGTPAALDSGILLAASSTISFDASKLFAGPIYCIAKVNSTTTISESK